MSLLSFARSCGAHPDVCLPRLGALAFVSLLTLNACTPAKVVPLAETSLYDKNVASLQQVFESRQPQPSEAGSAEEALKHGDELLASGDTGGALLSYLQGHKLAPRDSQLMVRLGRLHRDRKEFDLAEQALHVALELDPKSPEPRVMLGLMKLDARDRPAAEQLLAEALQLDAASWEAHEGLGVLADLRRDHAAAVGHYEAALKIHPSPRLLNNLGYSYYLAGDPARARSLFQQALTLDPSFQRAQYNLGLVAAKLGEYEEAVAIFSKLMKPEAAYNNVGYLCMMEGKYEEADAYFRKAIELSPSYNAIANENMKTLERLRGN